ASESLYSKGAELMQGLWDKIGQWGGKFFNAGKNIVVSIADGIRGAIGTVKDAIGSVVQSIRDYLPFSPAKVGPLKDLNKLNFGGTISESIYNAKKPISDAMADLAQLTLIGYDAIANIESKITYKALPVVQNDLEKRNYGGDTYNFYSPKALTPVESRRQQKKARREVLFEF
ncbi:MAG: hypothetical protein RRY35_08600, partial [Clostridiales bacterium]